MNHRQGSDRSVYPVSIDELAQIEVREIVGVARQERLFAVDSPPVGEKRAGAPEQFWLEEGADRWRRGACGNVAAHHVWQVVKVDEDLIDTRTAERIEPDVEQRPFV